ncbi:MAG TPA: DUF1559 domain-containing protein [Thermoguttaceae bacterium]
METLKKSMCIILILTLLFCGCRQWFREQIGLGVERQDTIHLNFISLALGNYVNANGKMPSNITDKEGKPLLSWRVALLEHFDPELYNQFKLDEPWNSPHNLKVAQTVSFIYVDPKGPQCTPIPPDESELAAGFFLIDPKAPNHTPYLGVTGPNAAFRPGNPRDVNMKDQHAAIVVVDKSDVFWSEPRDISLEDAKKGDSLRWYVNETMYLTAGGMRNNWKKGAPKDAHEDMGQPPNYEYESDK